ncbi:MAG: GlsB/YeaQ/YmgE family stress response membrane protein [Gemmatimonadota bacterium]
MTFLTGFLIWLVLGVGAGLVLRATYPGPTTTAFLSVFFGVVGAFIGGMLGVAPYVTHDPTPLRIGGLIGAVLGALLFPFIYHLVARKAL